MFHWQNVFGEYPTIHSMDDKIYAAMSKDDTAEVVMTVLDYFIKLKREGHIPHSLISKFKSEHESDKYRMAGNESFKRGNYQIASENYNKALAAAPNNTRAMKLAYSNRSAVLFEVKAYDDCIKDIDRCFAMGCPQDIQKKLIKRRREAYRYNLEICPVDDVFKFYITSPNSSIPSVSSQIKIEIDNQNQPKFTAVDPIKIGTVVAQEVAYITCNVENIYVSCYYCLKTTLCLIPCDRCCLCLFCSEECKTKCAEEYHDIECQVKEKMEETDRKMPLVIKTAIKLKNKANTWQELIDASKYMGMERLQNSSLEDIFNADSQYSLLTFADNNPFIYGQMYKCSIKCAAALYFLSEIPLFFPKNAEKKQEALRAFARIVMYLYIYGTHDQNIQALIDRSRHTISLNQNECFYTCLGKFKMACKPNVIILYHHNRAVLIAIQKINPGDEIITTNPSLAFDEDVNNMPKVIQKDILFYLKGYVCKCPVCVYAAPIEKQMLSEYQKQYYRRVNIAQLRMQCTPTSAVKTFDIVKILMEVLSDVPYSDEYAKAKQLFHLCLLSGEKLISRNTNI